MILDIETAKQILLETLKRKGMAEGTLKLYVDSVASFEKYLFTKNITDLRAVSEKDIQGYLDYLKEYISIRHKRPLSPHTTSYRIKCIRILFRILVLDGYVFQDPFRQVKGIKITSNLPRDILSQKEIGAFFNLPDVFANRLPV